ncbi:hypothetical protein J7384_17915 [Endozoicomonas sp. G2_1]|uniref:hypothetical protein n=1 Tax=Endozoicomonas sp. G2_1 TaxID=2821091 RepID=UPI001ADCD735|nr:hypothetical protein [Endozoicomonas sp. G2_1]MBO9492243.1 hypothetical protein [Endozoicomonas sp. G2_1]
MSILSKTHFEYIGLFMLFGYEQKKQLEELRALIQGAIHIINSSHDESEQLPPEQALDRSLDNNNSASHLLRRAQRNCLEIKSHLDS